MPGLFTLIKIAGKTLVLPLLRAGAPRLARRTFQRELRREFIRNFGKNFGRRASRALARQLAGKVPKSQGRSFLRWLGRRAVRRAIIKGVKAGVGSHIKNYLNGLLAPFKALLSALNAIKGLPKLGSGSTSSEKEEFGSPITLTFESEGEGAEYGGVSLRGVGASSFDELEEEAMQMFADYMVTLREGTNAKGVDETVDLGSGEVVGSLSVESENEDVTVVDDSAETYEEENKQMNKTFTYVSIGILGLLSYLGIRVVVKEGKTMIEVRNERALMEELEKLSPELKGIAFSKSDVLGYTSGDGGSVNVQYAQGTIYDRLGIAGYRKTTDYGVYRSWADSTHNAIDIATPLGTVLRAPFSGTIQYVDVNAAKAGTYVELVSEDGKSAFRFLHLSSVPHKAGDKVKEGDILAYTGNSDGGATRSDGSSWSSGAHLHIEYWTDLKATPVGTSIWRRGRNTNPEVFGATFGKDVEVDPEMGSGLVQDTVKGSQLPALNPVYHKDTKIGKEGNNVLSVTGKDDWEGKTGSIGNFPTFDTLHRGLRAGAINLRSYQKKHDVSNSGGRWVTIGDIANNNKGHNYVTKDNNDDIEKWVKTVSEVSGFDSDERIDLDDSMSLARVMRGIAFAEHSVSLDVGEVYNLVQHFNIVTTGIPSNTQ